MLLSVARSEVARRKRGVKAESRTVIDAAHKAIEGLLCRTRPAGAPACRASGAAPVADKLRIARQ